MISQRTQLREAIARVQDAGAVIEEIQLDCAIAGAIIGEMLAESDLSHIPNSVLRITDSVGLKYFDGYPVVTTETGAGVKIIYH